MFAVISMAGGIIHYNYNQRKYLFIWMKGKEAFQRKQYGPAEEKVLINSQTWFIVFNRKSLKAREN